MRYNLCIYYYDYVVLGEKNVIFILIVQDCCCLIQLCYGVIRDYIIYIDEFFMKLKF